MQVGSYLVGFYVEGYLVDYDWHLLYFIGYYLGASYFCFLLTNFVKLVGPCLPQLGWLVEGDTSASTEGG